MRYSRSDLLQLKDYKLTFDEDMTFTEDVAKQFSRIRKIDKINVKGEGHYNPDEQRLYINLKVNGTVVCGCDITAEDVDVEIHGEEDDIFTFDKKDENPDAIKSEGEFIELMPTIFQMILIEIPLKIVKPGKIEYPKGEGWEVVTEETYLQQKQNRTDPRLAALKNYKPQE